MRNYIRKQPFELLKWKSGPNPMKCLQASIYMLANKSLLKSHLQTLVQENYLVFKIEDRCAGIEFDNTINKYKLPLKTLVFTNLQRVHKIGAWYQEMDHMIKNFFEMSAKKFEQNFSASSAKANFFATCASHDFKEPRNLKFFSQKTTAASLSI